jgi:hypothetical protein
MASRRGEGATWDETVTLGDSLAIIATSEQVAESGAHDPNAIVSLIVRFHAACALKKQLISLQLAASRASTLEEDEVVLIYHV